MADEKSSGESKELGGVDAATPRRVKAPPKMAPPPSTKDTAGAKNAAEPTKKKKALPPPSNPPPKGGVSAAAAFRAKSSLPPPNGPPPNGAAPSASVAKIRGAARPPSGAPPSGGQAKTMAPPSMAPPSTTPPPKGEAKALSTPRAAESKSDAKTASVPPARAKPDDKRTPPTSSRSPPVEAKVTPRAAPVDILGDDSPALVHASTHMKNGCSAPPTAKPPRAMRAPMTAPPGEKAPTTNPMHAVVKKSTMEVLNDTTAALSSRHRNLDDEPAPLRRSSTSRPDHEGNAGGVFTTKMGKAAQFSIESRPNVPEEEVITVKRRTSKKAEAEADGRDDGQAKAGSDEEAKKCGTRVHIPNLEDSFEDVEEIPFLEDVKPDAKSKAKNEEKPVAAEEDDPIIVMESKHGPPKASTNRSSSSQAVDKDEYKSNNFDVEDKEDADGLLTNRRNATHEDIYGELRKMKRGSPRDDDARSDSVESRGASFSDKKDRLSSHSDEGAKEATTSTPNGGGSREKSREKRKEKRRSKKEEPKKIQAQFFNPKSVPYIPDHLMDFVKRPLECGRGQIIKCFIERNDSGSNKLAPIYTLLLEVNSSSGRPIMYARKKPTSRLTSHYVISMNRDDLFLSRMMRSHQYIGKLRSTTGYMEYSLYDQGDNPEDVDSDCEVDDEIRQSVRADLGFIRYHNSKKSYPRKMEVAIPAVLENGTGYVEWRPLSRDQMMEEHVRTILAAGGQNVLDSSNFIFLHKRETKYDPLSSCIVDFRSRATCVSVKNFQLVHSEPMSEPLQEQYRKAHPDYVYEDQGTVSLPQEHVLLQLGKVGKDCFNMDFQYPLSMIQAFAICLSRFDSKQR